MIARMVLETLNVENDLQPYSPGAASTAIPWRQARVEDIGWARDYLLPWVLRRVRHQSSGDGISAKRPDGGRVTRAN